MSKDTKIIILFAASILIFIWASNTLNAQNKKSRFIYNNDGTYTLGNFYNNQRPISIEDVQEVVDVVANTQITTYMICHGSSPVYFKSKYESSLGFPRKDKNDDNECDPNFLKAMKIYEKNINILSEKGTDIIDIILKRAREKKMEAFITMRMNDLHFTDTSLHCSRAYSDFWRKHPEFWVGDHPGWHAYGALNFAKKEVREYKLNQIREMCEKYDFDGFDLDFMRFIIYFPYKQGHKYINEMNGFVKEVSEIMKDTEKKRGHKIILSARVPAPLATCIGKGLDVKHWVNNKLIDFVTIGAHWECDPNLPIRQFRKELGNPDIPIYASIDDGQYYPRETRSDGMFRAIAANYYSEGADGLYMFNYFFEDSIVKRLKRPEPEKDHLTRSIFLPEGLNELGNPETLKNKNKIYSLSDGIVEYGIRPNTPLPKLISPWVEEDISFNIADDISKNPPVRALLMFRVTKGAKFDVYFNSIKIQPSDTGAISKFGRNRNLGNEEEVQVYSIPVSTIIKGANMINFRSIEPAPRLLKRVEIIVDYGDPEKYGYF